MKSAFFFMDRLCTPEVPTEDVLVLGDRERESGAFERLKCGTEVVVLMMVSDERKCRSNGDMMGPFNEEQGKLHWDSVGEIEGKVKGDGCRWMRRVRRGSELGNQAGKREPETNNCLERTTRKRRG